LYVSFHVQGSCYNHVSKRQMLDAMHL